MESKPTLLTPYGYSSSTCGYCSPSGERSDERSSKKYGLSSPQMSAQYYQKLVDRGWRRSGTYIYHPDMARTCCPQYTIRLDAEAFRPGKKHRQVMNRWNRYLHSGLNSGEGSTAPHSQGQGKGKGKAKVADPNDWMQTLEEHEIGYGVPGKHRFETQLVPAKATKETFELYKRYQVFVHKDKPEDVTMKGFKRFLCDSPLVESPIPYHSPPASRLLKRYGSYHLLYRVDGDLIGISVIDILPSCVSSVYFIWDPDWAWASLGKLSALREIALAREIRDAGAEEMGWLYMGYWIPNCQKMRYKSECAPSYLLDPGTQVFHLLDCKLDTFLQANPRGYHPFADISQDKSTPSPEANGDRKLLENGDDEDEDEWPDPPPPGMLDPHSVSEITVDKTLVLLSKGLGGQRLLKIEDLQFNQPDAVRTMIREMIAALGEDLVANASRPMQIPGAGILHFG